MFKLQVWEGSFQTFWRPNSFVLGLGDVSLCQGPERIRLMLLQLRTRYIQPDFESKAIAYPTGFEVCTGAREEHSKHEAEPLEGGAAGLYICACQKHVDSLDWLRCCL